MQLRAPTLRPGDIVILDILPARGVIAARDAIEAVGARMMVLPPNSPDFNPIENAVSKLNAIQRVAAARSVPELRDAVRASLPSFHHTKNARTVSRPQDMRQSGDHNIL